MKKILTLAVCLLAAVGVSAQNKQDKAITQQEMQRVYDEVKTPYKYGLVVTGRTKKEVTDCPTIFRRDGRWYMYYFIFNGRGYETWMAVSDNLLDWETQGRVLSFSDKADWDSNQKGGYIARALKKSPIPDSSRPLWHVLLGARPQSKLSDEVRILEEENGRSRFRAPYRALFSL